MAKQFEYHVCLVQLSHVSFVDGVWQGKFKPTEANAIDTCTAVWDYLAQVGQEGWELVGAVNMIVGEGNNFQQLYLKREKA